MILTASDTIAKLLKHIDSPDSKSEFLQQHGHAAIYGAGNMGKKVCQILVDAGVDVVCFLDQNAKPGANWQGIPIYPPASASLSVNHRQQLSVVIGICNGVVNIPTLKARIQEWGFGRVTTFMEFHQYFEAEIGQHYWLTERRYYAGLQTLLTECSELWADQASQKLFLNILEYRLTGNYEALPAPDPTHQYFPPRLPSWPTPLRFVDCGAFNGDTLGHILRNGTPVEAVAAFEPDPVNFLELRNFVHRQQANLPGETSIWPCGVAAATEQLRFATGEGVGSRLSGSGETVIQCIALDDVLPHFRPNLIKMDIEGAELQSLMGARQTIFKSRPGLAICVYHHPAHLWQIPLMLNSWDYGYKFYLCSHELNGFELVMYALAG